jgi:putative transposase
MPFKPVARLRTFEYRGPYRYFVTICVRNRASVFVNDGAIACVLLQLQHTSVGCGFAVIAYCFMPDHLHLLIEGATGAADFREFMRLFKQRSSFQWKRSCGGDLWQRGYYDHVLREDEDIIGVARYVLANPVRAGLVEDPTTYPFLGSFALNVRDLLDSIRTYE